MKIGYGVLALAIAAFVVFAIPIFEVTEVIGTEPVITTQTYFEKEPYQDCEWVLVSRPPSKAAAEECRKYSDLPAEATDEAKETAKRMREFFCTSYEAKCVTRYKTVEKQKEVTENKEITQTRKLSLFEYLWAKGHSN